MNGIVKGNKIYCPVCEKHNATVIDKAVVNSSKGRAYKFTSRCNECFHEFEYLKIIRIESDLVFVEKDTEEVEGNDEVDNNDY